MEMPSSTASSETLLRTFGTFHAAALAAGGDATREVERAFAGSQERLEGALASRLAADAAESRAEALRVAAEVEVEANLATVDGLALLASGRKRAVEPYVRVFPHGLTGAVTPAGHDQLVEGRRVVGELLDTSGALKPGIPAELLAPATALAASLDRFDAALTTEQSAHEATNAAFSAELSARRGWREQYRKDFGVLTALFGGDKKKVESFFKRAPQKKKSTPVPQG